MLVAGTQEHPEHVVLVEVTGCGALGGFFEHDRVERGHRPADPREAALPALAPGVTMIVWTKNRRELPSRISA